MGKELLTEKDLRFLLNIEEEDEFTITDPSMEKLVETIKSDPNCKKNLRAFFNEKEGLKEKIARFFGKDPDELKLEDRCNYLKNNYCLSEFEVTEESDYEIPINPEPVPADNKPVNYNFNDLESLRNFIETEGYKNLVAENEEAFSSVEVRLTESGTIEKDEKDGLRISWRKEPGLNCKHVFLMEKTGNTVLAIGQLVRDECDANRYWAVFNDVKYIYHDKFEGKTQVRIVVYDVNNIMHSCISELNYSKLGVESDKPLCIDFGTSNTTAGSYGIRTTDEIEEVKFVDVTVEPHRIDAAMIPTVVYVEDCSDSDNIKYLFGYEALKRIEVDEKYEFKGSAFFEIKRWMTSPSRMEELKDCNNNTVKEERRKIIKAYIDYVIDKAEIFFGRRFEKIHFSAPVKMKSMFIQTFKDLYANEKTILTEEESIDEAFAIVYNQIVDIVDHEKKDIEDKSILIMDCGGGTTDLANCTFSYKKKEGYTSELKYTTRFENGNSNFGGNNITYRVMQLLKIKIASQYDNTLTSDAMLLINKQENDILNISNCSEPQSSIA